MADSSVDPAACELACRACAEVFHAWRAGEPRPALAWLADEGYALDTPRFTTWLESLRPAWVEDMARDPVTLRAALMYELFCADMLLRPAQAQEAARSLAP